MTRLPEHLKSMHKFKHVPEIEDVRKAIVEVNEYASSETVLDTMVYWIARAISQEVTDSRARREWIAAFTDDYTYGGYKLADALEEAWKPVEVPITQRDMFHGHKFSTVASTHIQVLAHRARQELVTGPKTIEQLVTALGDIFGVVAALGALSDKVEYLNTSPRTVQLKSK